MIAFGLLLKSFFSGAMSFMARYWRIILPVLILAAAYLYVNSLQGQRDEAKKALSDYKAAQTALATQQIAENAIKLAKGKVSVNFSDQSATAQLTQLNLDRKHETDNIKALYEDKIANLKHNLAKRLQSSTTDSASKTTIVTSDTETDSAAQSISNAAVTRIQAQYDTLENACIITTVDFNNLRTWADIVCDIAVCE